MAKITIAGDAVVITSAMKLEELRTIAKYRPDALVLKGGEDGKEDIFKIAPTNGVGEINKYGASFNGESHDEQKLATITTNLGAIEGDVRENVAEKVGNAIINLNKIEAKLPEVLREIGAEKAEILSNITVAQ